MPVEHKRDAGAERNVGGVCSKEPGRQVYGNVGTSACTRRDDPRQGNVVDAMGGDSAGDSLSRSFNARNVEVREKVVDPLSVGFGSKCSNVNVIVPRHI